MPALGADAVGRRSTCWRSRWRSLTLLVACAHPARAPRRWPLRDPRRRGRGRGDGRADLSLQAGRASRSRARSPASPAASRRCSCRTSPPASTFNITVPLTVVLMSVLGGTRHWAGPGRRRDRDHRAALRVHGRRPGGGRQGGRSARCSIAAILFMPDGILGRALQRARRRARRPPARRAPQRRRAQCRRALGADDRLAVARGRGAAGARRGRCCACAACASRFKRRARARRRRPRRASRRDPGPARSERLGQVDAHQRRQRPLPCRRRQRSSSRAASSAALPAHRIAARRHRAHLPDPAAVRAPDACSTTSRSPRCSAARARRATRRDAQAMRWLEFTGLDAQGRARCPDDLNLHQRKFLELARALASRPRLVLLDEVLSRPDAERDRRRGRADPAHPRPGHDDRLRRARDARGDGAVRPHRRLRPGERARRGQRRPT